MRTRCWRSWAALPGRRSRRAPTTRGHTTYCHRFTSAQNSRHIDRKLFKMRELRGAGVVVVKTVPTEDNPADLFTKVLIKQAFEKLTSRTWHCLVGRNFACYVTYESKSFAYFYIGQQGVCLFCTD